MEKMNDPVINDGNRSGLIREALPAVVFWCVAVGLLFASLGVKEIWGPEDRWAEIAREMRLTGDYFHPTINGKPYFDKPLLSYWFIAWTSMLMGRMDETVLRIPSAIAGLLALWGTVRLGRKLFDKKTAITAGWILLSSYGFIFWARTGEADMENLAAIVLAVLWYWSRRDKPGFVSYLVFYLICFIGAHTKGMASIAVPVIVVLPDIIREGRWRKYVSISHFVALVIGVGIYLAPFLYAYMTKNSYGVSGLWFAFRENIMRYFNAFDHKEPFYVYFYYVPKLFFPWTILFVGAVWAFCGHFRKLGWQAKWLAISTLLIFLFFTLSGSRRSYYILPIIPFCALMSARYLVVEPKEKSKDIFVGIQMGMFFVLLIIEGFSPFIWNFIEEQIGFVAPWGFKISTFVLGGSALVCLMLHRFEPRLFKSLLGGEEKLVGPIAVALILVGGFFVWQQNSLESFRTLKSFSLELKEQVVPDGDAKVVLFGAYSPKMVFHLDTPGFVYEAQDVEGLRKYAENASEKWYLVAHNEDEEVLSDVMSKELIENPTLQEKIYPWQKNRKIYKAWLMDGSN